jgi:pimeloyl-ACP methyl ester carboxylesterase
VVLTRRIRTPRAGTRYLEVAGAAPDRPVLLLHGNPTNADDWVPFMEALAGRRRCLAPDLPGWGQSDRSPALRHTMHDLAGFVEGFLDALGISSFDLVAHDWGGAGLIAAQRRPHAVGRVVLINTVPLLPGYRWHWIARMWRRRGVGEVLNATVTGWSARTLLRLATPGSEPAALLAGRMLAHWDAGMRRAILELYRDADPERLAAAGRGLGDLEGPSLVLWGDRDPYLGVDLAGRYAAALGGDATLELVRGAGHWPWLDRPEVVGRVAEFLART